MFSKILIANRGEIACRIIQTARRLGIYTVAVHSSADAGSRHVMMADQAVPIGGPAPRDSYLRGDRIIAAALTTGAEAIHPGYGFLSENPDFAQSVKDAGLVFVGPSAAAIRAMGLKDAAKARMEKAGVPVIPGYHGENQDPAHLADTAKAIGYPVLIKAVAGGGGKGMRRVDRPNDFAAALTSASAEASAAFGNAAVLIEKYIVSPRHIEVQVFGDGTDALHLFERDCSLQRRHQKVIEEAPAPGMTPAMRHAMGDAAVRAAKAVGYKGAGTVEFIADASAGLREDRFWFMEMNTRLQVEHPVTEAITGVDLVEWQLRVAAGEPLPLRQHQLAANGHALEARLYAEDVAAGFLPATGRIEHLAFPPEVRVDTGVRSGDVIGPWYDPMIAKIVVHGPTRAVALSRLARALDDTRIAGTTTNLALLASLARHSGFVAGQVDTGLIERDLDSLSALGDVDRTEDAAMVAAAALHLANLPSGPLTGFALWHKPVWRIDLTVAGVLRPVQITMDGPDQAQVCVGEITVAARRQSGAWVVDGRALSVVAVGSGVHVFGCGRSVSALRYDPISRPSAPDVRGKLTLSPMPGAVKAVHVTEGQRVKAGDVLCVLEAMKMEHGLRAQSEGVVAEVLVAAGNIIEAGVPLIRLEDGI